MRSNFVDDCGSEGGSTSSALRSAGMKRPPPDDEGARLERSAAQMRIDSMRSRALAGLALLGGEARGCSGNARARGRKHRFAAGGR